MQPAVVGHPRREQSCLGGRRKEFCTGLVAVPAAEQAFDVAGQVLDQGVAGVSSAKAVVEHGKQVRRHPDAFHVGRTDPRSREIYG